MFRFKNKDIDNTTKNSNIIDIDELCLLLNESSHSDTSRSILGQSLFYYCCGKDPTPIVAFKSRYPLYIYVDNFEYIIQEAFASETNELYNRLNNHNFKLIEKYDMQLTGKLKNAKKAALTLWEDNTNNTFYLLYVQCDAVEVFKYIYADRANYIMPKCISNFKFELNSDFFEQIENNVEFIMGYCNSKKYQCIAEYDYLGDYEDNAKVKLFRRMCYYLY